MKTTKKRHGFAPLPERRRTCVLKIRLRLDEKNLLSGRAKQRKKPLASYIREAALNRMPPIIPEINHECWQKLAPISANLNQLTHHLNGGLMLEAVEIRRIFSELRSALIGASSANADQIDADDEPDLPLDGTSEAQGNHQIVAGGNHERHE